MHSGRVGRLGEEAELVALRVGEHDPARVQPRAEIVDDRCAEAEQTVEFVVPDGLPA